MKFGATLQQRSVPQWSNCTFRFLLFHLRSAYNIFELDNVDYDEIKNFIKKETTHKDKASPVHIPGQHDTEQSRPQFEDELYEILKDQYERINLFTKSKHGEIERRLDSLRYQSSQLSKSSPLRPQDGRRYDRLAQEANSVRDDIQLLSRYISTQRVAFRKLLKKYHKWTGSKSLEARFDRNTFQNTDTKTFVPAFDEILSRFAEIQTLLEKFRQRLQNAQGSVRESRREPQALRAGSLSDILKQGKTAEFDARFSMIPARKHGGIAKYWVHRDNLFEVRVRLLGQMKDPLNGSSASILRHGSSGSLTDDLNNRSASTLNQRDGDLLKIEVVDDLERFRKDQSAATIRQTEHPATASPTEATVVVIQSSKPEAAIITRRVADSGVPPIILCDRVAALELLKQPGISHGQASSTKNSHSPSNRDLSILTHWLARHPNTEPLAQVTSHRSRFQGLQNSAEHALWSVLDTDITVRPGTRSDVPGAHVSQQERSFPHAILEIRWEGSVGTPDVVKGLDESHLAERIRGFSTEAYAIYVLYNSGSSALPIWAPLLELDIRKLPPKQDKRRSRKGRSTLTAESSNRSSNQSSTDDPSSSVFSTGVIQSSATSIGENTQVTTDDATAKKKRKPRRGTKQAEENLPYLQRYWNEFDEEEEQESNEYTVLVDPDASFPGAELLSSIYRRAKSLFSRVRNQERQGEDERQPLLRNQNLYPSDDDTSSSEGAVSFPRIRNGFQRSYRSIVKTTSQSSLHRRHRSRRERRLFRSYLACYLVAVAFLLTASLLEAFGGRRLHRHRRQSSSLKIHAAAAVSVGFALLFACIGTLLIARRDDRLSWAHRLAAFLGTMVICGVSVWLVVVLGSEL